MQGKSSFRQLIRTPVKTALFILLIACVTAFLCFGINMQLSVKQSLEEAHASFTTIGVVKHGVEGRSFCFWDTAIDYSPISNSPYVLQFDQRQFFTAYCPDMLVSNEAYRGGNFCSILRFEALSPSKGQVLEVLFDRTEEFSPGDEIALYGDSDIDFIIETGKQYIASFQAGRYGRVEDAASDNFVDTPAGQAWNEWIKKNKDSLHSFGVYSTNDIQSMLAFHQGNAVLAAGRFFSREEYQNGERVCIINEATAENNNLEIGDYIALHLYVSNSAWTDLGPDGIEPDLAADLLDTGSFEIIGTYRELINMGPEYGIPEQIVFIPQDSISHQPGMISNNNLVSFRLENGSPEAFMAEIEEHLSDIDEALSISIYDQGYSKISGALDSMKSTAMLLTVVGAGAGLILIVLLGNLFVGRELRAIAIMYSLGVSRQKCLAFLMLGILMLVGTAAILGGSISFALSNTIMNSVYARSLETAEIDLIYSDIYGAQVDAHYDLILPKPWLAPTLAILTVLLASLAVSLIYAARILRAEPMQVMAVKEYNP
ncbi:MAG TPA: hypothetical protein DG577_02305 [Firmicutes bacterium]|jgi:hypothetical protein|nr:hypothetical protein [Bacillota bacterium]HCX78223.1 hypothetical protein [Bacillota bacterium]